MKQAVHFGAGNIGRGFIGDLLHESGYHITFIDINEDLVKNLNESHEYELYLIDHDYGKKTINNVSAIAMKDTEKIVDAICNADLITTSVWANNLPKVAPIIAEGLKLRWIQNKPKINVIACENAMFATQILKKAMIDCAVDIDEIMLDKVAAYPSTAVDRVVLGDNKEGKPVVNIADYHELAIEKDKLVNSEELPMKSAKYTDNLQKYLQRKLYIVNCGHAFAGYIGYINGYKNARDVFLYNPFVEQVKEAMLEAAAFIENEYDFSHEEMLEYVDFAVKRYQAKGVDYDITMVTRSPIRKLGANDRMVGPCLGCEKYNLKNEFLLKGIALIFLLDNDDAEAVQLQEYIKENGIEKAIEHFTTIQQNTRMFTTILNYYQEGKLVRDKYRK